MCRHHSILDQLLPLQKSLHHHTSGKKEKLSEILWELFNVIHVLQWSKAIKIVGVPLFLNYIWNHWDINRWTDKFSRIWRTVLSENILNTYITKQTMMVYRKTKSIFQLDSKHIIRTGIDSFLLKPAIMNSFRFPCFSIVLATVKHSKSCIFGQQLWKWNRSTSKEREESKWGGRIAMIHA